MAALAGNTAEVFCESAAEDLELGSIKIVFFFVAAIARRLLCCKHNNTEYEGFSFSLFFPRKLM